MAQDKTDDLVERLAKLDTCAASDSLDRLGLRGATIGIRPVWPCPRIVGRAVTCKIKPAGLEKSKQHLGTPAIDAAKPGDVIVIDSDREESRLRFFRDEALASLAQAELEQAA